MNLFKCPMRFQLTGKVPEIWSVWRTGCARARRQELTCEKMQHDAGSQIGISQLQTPEQSAIPIAVKLCLISAVTANLIGK